MNGGIGDNWQFFFNLFVVKLIFFVYKYIFFFGEGVDNREIYQEDKMIIVQIRENQRVG